MRKVEFGMGWSIADAMTYLTNMRNEIGEECYGTFNDVDIFSTDSLDDAYKRITGKTKAEFEAREEEWREKYEEAKRKHQESIPKLTKLYREKARGLVLESELDFWDKIVPIRLGDLYQGMELQQVLDCATIMKDESLPMEDRLQKAYKIFMDAGHSGMSAGLTMQMLRRFCPHGNELADACYEFRYDKKGE